MPAQGFSTNSHVYVIVFKAAILCVGERRVVVMVVRGMGMCVYMNQVCIKSLGVGMDALGWSGWVFNLHVAVGMLKNGHWKMLCPHCIMPSS